MGGTVCKCWSKVCGAYPRTPRWVGNWDSDLTPWNVVDMGPKRDLVGDLGKAVRAKGLKYAPSYHRERHTSFFTTKKYVVDAKARRDIPLAGADLQSAS